LLHTSSFGRQAYHIKKVIITPQIRELNIKLMKEGLEVIKLAGIKTAPVPGFPLSLMETMAKTSSLQVSYLF